MSKWGLLLPTLLFTLFKAGKLYRINFGSYNKQLLTLNAVEDVCVCCHSPSVSGALKAVNLFLGGMWRMR